MIKIEFYKNGCIITGHAGAEQKGKDIYCAAVSSISQSAINWFELEDINYEIEDGYLKLEIINQSEKNLYLLNLLSIQLHSLNTKQYQKFIKFQDYEKEI